MNASGQALQERTSRGAYRGSARVSALPTINQCETLGAAKVFESFGSLAPP